MEVRGERVLCDVMWTDEGIQFYKTMLENWKMTYQDEDLWKKFKVLVWDAYVIENKDCVSLGTHWRKRPMEKEATDDNDGGD